jgi:hypothetical protein
MDALPTPTICVPACVPTYAGIGPRCDSRAFSAPIDGRSSAVQPRIDGRSSVLRTLRPSAQLDRPARVCRHPHASIRATRQVDAPARRRAVYEHEPVRSEDLDRSPRRSPYQCLWRAHDDRAQPRVAGAGEAAQHRFAGRRRRAMDRSRTRGLRRRDGSVGRRSARARSLHGRGARTRGSPGFRSRTPALPLTRRDDRRAARGGLRAAGARRARATTTAGQQHRDHR